MKLILRIIAITAVASLLVGCYSHTHGYGKYGYKSYGWNPGYGQSYGAYHGYGFKGGYGGHGGYGYGGFRGR